MTAPGISAEVVERTCGNCSLWGAHFYGETLQPNNTCCADVVMDLPASFIPARQAMLPSQGAGCICWRPLGATKP